MSLRQRFIQYFGYKLRLTIGAAAFLCMSSVAAPLNITQTPLFIGGSSSPLTMLILDRSHALYTAAYNDNSDLNGDGTIEFRFNPDFVYYGYFNSDMCYDYDSVQKYFYIKETVSDQGKRSCSHNYWSGNFLNYLTMSKLDVFRKMLYGGYRSTDTTTSTILERSYVPQDGHSWAKDFQHVNIDGYKIIDYTPFAQPGHNKAHLFVNTTLRNSGAGEPLLRVAVNQPYRAWDWVAIEPPVAGDRVQNGVTGPSVANSIQDFVVRVKVCDPTIALEDNCTVYPNGKYKPTGILQNFGANNAMYFGLITGSYGSNLNGGVLRKNMGSISDEINASTGQLTATNGIMSTLNKLTVTGFGTNYTYDCGYITTRNINNGECQMWGNPLAEMIFESARYFASKGSPTSSYTYGSGGTDDTLGLAKPAWTNPYATYPSCSKPMALIITASPPSYDSDLIPGSAFLGLSSDLSPALDAASLGQTIFTGEGFSSVSAMVGQVGSVFNGTPTPKIVTSFGNIRGLTAEDANQEGTFYAASAAYYAWINDLNPLKGVQNMLTKVVAFSSPLAEFKFNVGGKLLTVAPFAKTVKGLGINPAQGQFQPSDAVVSLFVESLTSTQVIFRVNFANVQQGGNYTIGATVQYTVTINPNNTLTIATTTLQASGGLTEHLGFVISGTTQDGVYLVVRDTQTTALDDIDYFLDTPAGQGPGQNWQDGVALPTSSSRTFTPGSTPSTTFFNSPLWYAAKWGGFNDENKNNKPDIATEFSSTGGTNPDNYISGIDPNGLQVGLQNILTVVPDQKGTASMPAANSSQLHTGSVIFQPQFQLDKWRGDLLAFNLDPTTGQVVYGSDLDGSLWSAQARLAAVGNVSSRVMITYNPTTPRGVAFRWASGSTGLSAAQQTALNTNPVTGNADAQGSNRLNFIRGVRTQEIQNGGIFRNRKVILGDIIHSNPTYVGPPALHYPNTWGTNAPENSTPYTNFEISNSSRTPVVYVGANDGALHGFNATTGQEVLAYIPSSLYSTLPQLTNPNYSHQYYVDGSPIVRDAFIGGQWRTILVGTLGAGGQGVFALDITDPTQFSEGNAAALVKWEFTDTNDADMGFSFSEASIVRLANGQWAAVFGNGYNNTSPDSAVSTTGNAVLYIVNLSTGALIKKFDTQVGMQQDPLALGRPNGMSSPLVVSAVGANIANYIYAGDLFGNLWKIDVSATNPAQWAFSFNAANKPVPFFIAVDGTGRRQPITARPTVSGRSYIPAGLRIYIGTGQYIQSADTTDMNVQSIYGLIDNGSSSISGRGSLLTQTILTEADGLRTVSNNSLSVNQKGWLLDLAVNGAAQGERLVSPIRYMNKKIIFSTLIPSSDACKNGGQSWLMEMNAEDGSRLGYYAFNSPAMLQQQTQMPASGMASIGGIMPMPAILQSGSKEFLLTADTGGNLTSIQGDPGQQAYGRQSWRQLQ